MRRIKDFMIWLAVAIGCFVFTRLTSAGSDKGSMTFNYVFMLMIIILYGIGLFGGFFRIYKLTVYFRFANKTIDTYPKKDRNKHIMDKIEDIRRDKDVDIRLNSFLDDLKSSNSGFVEIADYINNDEADDIIHKWLLDMIPDLFTTLGILGTFIGLVWGLKGFDPSSIDTMGASVTNLINGIKVAFLTSIYGMIASLAFTYTMSKDYSELTANVAEFIDKFHAYIVPSADMESRNRSFSMQSEQSSAMSRLSNDLQDSLSIGVTESITPKLEEVQSSLESINTTIGERFEREQEETEIQDDDNTERVIEILENISNAISDSSRASEDSLSQLIQSSEDTQQLIGSLITELKNHVVHPSKGGISPSVGSPIDENSKNDFSDTDEDDMLLSGSGLDDESDLDLYS